MPSERTNRPGAEVMSVGTPLGLNRPRDVLSREDMSRREKIDVLEQWAQDLREQMVAEEEAMPAAPGASPSEILREALEGLASLGAEKHPPPVPTKHG